MSALQLTGRGPIGCRSATRTWVAVATLLGALVFGAGPVSAALFRLRAQCQSSGAVVTLGDVAEISAADPQQADALAAVELFPAPPAPRQRFVRLREIQDLLLLRGVNLAEHRFSGSSRVTVLGRGKPVESKPDRPVSAWATRSANRRVIEAVAHYLQEYVSADPSWIVKVELDPSRARLVADPGRAISITGGAPPSSSPSTRRRERCGFHWTPG